MSLYEKIKNPVTGKNVSIYGKLGKNILANYLEMYQFGGSEALAEEKALAEDILHRNLEILGEQIDKVVNSKTLTVELAHGQALEMWVNCYYPENELAEPWKKAQVKRQRKAFGEEALYLAKLLMHRDGVRRFSVAWGLVWDYGVRKGYFK